MTDRQVGILAGIAALFVVAALYMDGSFDPWLNDAGRAANAVSGKVNDLVGNDGAQRRSPRRVARTQRAKPPMNRSTQQPVKRRRVYGEYSCETAQSAKLARLETEKTKLADGRTHSTVYVVSDLEDIALELNVVGKNIEYVSTSDGIYYSGSGRHKIGDIVHKDATKDWRYKLNWRWRPGATDTGATNHIYRLPYASGDAYPVSQSFNGRATHTGSSRYAVDFAMPIGTPIHAARSGIVVAACGKHNEGGFEKEYLTKGNSVSILHSDGSRAHYGHLREAGVMVKIGERVSVGDLIGYSGNTGYSSGPHLHFEVNEVHAGLEMQSVPFQFFNAEGQAITPTTGKSYTAGR